MNAHWYDAATPDERREYDGFGPWVLEVSNPVDRPPVFRAHAADFDAALVSLKFPLDKDRKDCRPGQVLYTAVWLLHAEKLVRLRWDGTQVIRDERPVDQVAGADRTTVLLRTEAAVSFAGGDRWVQLLSTGSKALIEAFFDRLLKSVAGQAAATLPEAGRRADSSEPADAWYASVVRAALRADPEARVVHFEEPGQPCRDPKGRRKRHQGLLVLRTKGEVQFHDRGLPGWKTKENTYAGRLVRVPESRWSGWSTEGQTLKVRAGEANWGFLPLGQIPAIWSEPK